MATKQNMYVGKYDQAVKIINEINDCVICWQLEDYNIKRISIYLVDKADKIRDDVSNMQGQLQVLINGLDKNSPNIPKYQSLLDKIDAFMELYK